MAFSLKTRIGRGRTTDTFAARLTIGEDVLEVAVKRPRPEFAHNEAFVAAFLRWAEEQKDLEHANLVGVFESGRTEEGAYVIEERVDGASLAEVLAALSKKKRTMSMKLALHVALQVAEGLGLLHTRGALHGELDPGEVLIAYEGEVKVADQRLHLLDVHLGAELAGDRAQRETYRAPELAGPGTPSAASDVYALALIVLEMLIGKPVWTTPSMTVEGAIAALRDFTHVGLANPVLTEDLSALLLECVRADPAARVPDGNGLAEKMRALIEKHGLRSEPGMLAGFVKALIPPAHDQDAAPTTIADAAALAALDRRHAERQREVEGASVSMDPDLDQKALSTVGRPAEPSPPSRTAGVRAPSPGRAMDAPGAAASSPMARLVSRFLRWKPSRHEQIAALVIAGLLVAAFVGRTLRRTLSEVQVLDVEITSVPEGAQVYLDGQRVGDTPIRTPYPAHGDEVLVRVELEGWSPYEVRLAPDDDRLQHQVQLARP